ncbi:MAG TPA: hypothetical protein VHB79_36135 [Polyangiaceae bacterium]|nr:hypothetical protein [Polyangiaceae bacterium]
MRRALLCLSVATALSTLFACHRSRDGQARDDRPRASARARTATAALPEDAAAGQLALARWTEHLKEEERARQANYDRRKLPEHEALVASIEQARASYDKAHTKAAVARAQARFRAGLPVLQSRVQHLDRWGRSSHLLKDYRALLELLANDYPKAKLAALAGSPENARHVDSELSARLTTIHDWLELAASAEEE